MSVEDRYYKINRILLKSLGIWPCQDSKWSRVQVMFVTTMYLSAIFVQLAVFITHECTLDIAIEVLSFTFPTIGMFIMYDIYYFNIDQMKEIMKHMYYDWKSFKNKMELNIMDDYASTARLLTEVFLFLFCVGLLAIVTSHSLPIILDVVSPLNESRKRHIHITVEYFVDHSKYYYFLLLHVMIFVCLGAITIIATGSTFLSYSFHACAMFKVTNYRMEITMDKHVLQVPSSEMERVIYKRIICAVNLHRRTIQYYKLLMSCFEKSFFIVIIIAVTSLSINLFRFLKAIKAFNEMMDIFITFTLVFGHFGGIFFANHVGQLITSNNAEIFNTVYSLPWYMAPLNVQKLLLLLLQMGNKNIYLSIAGIFDASYEGFATLTKASLSYFTVIYTIQ